MKIFHPGTVHFTWSGFYPTETLYPSATIFPEIPDLSLDTIQGSLVVQPLECIEKRNNNEWYLEVELQWNEYLVQDAICMVETKDKGEQPFRIKNIEVDNTVRFEAWHVGFDAQKYFVEYSTAVNADCQGAMVELLSNSEPFTTPFTVYSDIATIDTITITNQTLYDAFVELAEKYNGYLEFDKFEIKIVANQGVDNGVVLAYGKNIEQSSVHENWDNVVTRLYPLGNNEISLPERWLVADVQYDRAYAKQMAFDTDNVEDLRFVAELYLNRFKVPKVNYKVSGHVTGNVSIGDTILVKARQFEVFTDVMAYEFDINAKILVNVEFGNYQRTAKNAIRDYVESETQKIVDDIILRGLVRFENLTDGVTVIDGSNIQTGQVSAEHINFDGATGENVSLSGAIKATSGNIGRFAINNEDLIYTSELFAKDYDESDLARLRTILANGLAPTSYELFVYDLNNSGAITITDLTILRSYIEGTGPIPEKLIRSIITIGTTSGEIKTSTVAENGVTGQSFMMRTDKLNGNLVNTKAFATEKMYLNGIEVFVDANGFLKVT